MPKGKFPNLKGVISNISVETADITDILLQEAEERPFKG